MNALQTFVQFCENQGVRLSHAQLAIAKAIFETAEGRQLFGSGSPGGGKTTLLVLLEEFAHSLETPSSPPLPKPVSSIPPQNEPESSSVEDEEGKVTPTTGKVLESLAEALQKAGLKRVDPVEGLDVKNIETDEQRTERLIKESEEKG